jgi:hypothetical protein
MAEQRIERTGNILKISGTVRLPYGAQMDFSDYHEPIGCFTGVMEPIKAGAYYAEAIVDDNVYRTSLPAVPDGRGGLRFDFVPPLPTPQVYGLRYFRVHEGLRYNQIIEGIIP